jgi:NAD(P)-dependent dehydrogenase (short-subunit alcohol dehydrogenase family)
VEPEELGKITEENFDATFDLNARATLFTVQKALPLMRTGGSVILICSVADSLGVPGNSTYSATKAPCVPMSGPGPASSPTAASDSTP